MFSYFQESCLDVSKNKSLTNTKTKVTGRNKGNSVFLVDYFKNSENRKLTAFSETEKIYRKTVFIISY